MAQRLADELNFRSKLLLASIVMAAVAGPVVIGLLNAPQIRAQSRPTTGAPLPSFEVVSIKPSRPGEMSFSEFNWSRFTVRSKTAKWLIAFAYAAFQPKANLSDDQLSGGPGWIDSEPYDIDAKVEDSLAEELRQHTMGGGSASSKEVQNDVAIGWSCRDLEHAPDEPCRFHGIQNVVRVLEFHELQKLFLGFLSMADIRILPERLRDKPPLHI